MLVRAFNVVKQYYRQRLFLPPRGVETTAVNGISIDIAEGSITGVVGESGSGKSTFGRVLLGLEKAGGGRVEWMDNLLFDVEKKEAMPRQQLLKLRKDFQIIFQNQHASLSPAMTVFEIIQEGILKHKLAPKREIRGMIYDLFQKCSLDKEVLAKYPHELSGGQKQRVLIARSFILRPRFMVCDEPTASLDLSVQAQILNLFLDLKEQYNTTYLFISHNFTMVSCFCDEVCTIYRGRIIERGPAKEVYRRPLHPYTRMLIEAIPKYLYEHTMPEPPYYETDTARGEQGSGCSFAGNCKYSIKQCREDIPSLVPITKERSVACHLVCAP